MPLRFEGDAPVMECLPDGTYEMTVWAKSSGASGARLYATNGGVEDLSTEIESSLVGWTEIALRGIAVEEGACTIGVSTDSGSVTADDFMLSRSL